MTSIVERGRRYTLAIAIWIGVLPVVSSLLLPLAFRRSPVDANWSGAMLNALFSAALGLALAWFLYKAYRWARALVIVVEFVGALLPMVSLIVMARTPEFPISFQGAAYVLPTLLVKVAFALFLWRSRSISAYFDRENAATLATTP